MFRPIRKNDQFLMKYQLPDRETGFFIEAVIFDESMNEVSFSPIVLSHKQNGLYYDISQQATAIGNYTVQYTVYSDALLTNIAKKYSTAEEEVFVFDYDQLILTAVGAIPTNPVLDNDVRLDNLNLIPNKLDTTEYNTGKTQIIDMVNSNTDDSDGRAV